MYNSLKQFFSANGRLENNIVHKESISSPVNFKQVKHTKIDPTSPVGFEDIPLEWQEEMEEGKLTPKEYENMLKSYKKHVAKRKLSKRAETIKNMKEIKYIERKKGKNVDELYIKYYICICYREEVKKIPTVDEALKTLFSTSVYHSQKKINENIKYPTLEEYKKQAKEGIDDEEGEEEEEEEEEEDEFY